MDVGSDEAVGWFFENALDIFLVCTDGMIERANPAWNAFSGWTEEETQGRPLIEFVHPDDLGVIDTAVAQLARVGLADCEHRVRIAQDEWRWVRSRAKRVNERSVLIVWQDITAQRRAAKERYKGARVAELLGMAAGVFIWRYDTTTRQYDLNPLIEGRSTTPAHHVPADVFHAAIHPDDKERVLSAWSRSELTGEVGNVEYRHLGASGYRRMRTAWAGISQHPTGEWELLGITQDITELLDARDAAIETADAKTQFLANMSHEIRTPMNGVLGVLHLLKGESLSANGRVLVDEALACGTTLAQVLNDIVDFSRAEAGRLELTPEQTDAAAALRMVAGMVGPDAEAKGVTLTVEASEAGFVWLDPVRLRQMIFNLAGNAVKFTPQGGIRLSLSTSGVGDEQRLRVDVRDTGVGIPQEARANLFDRFQQADGSLTRRFGGSGLGLAMTKALAERMEGEVGFAALEAGSHFWFEIAAPACAAPAATGEAELWLEGLRVLVVEDNPTNRLVATRMLSDLGATVETADDGAQGVARAQTGAYDLIFMDIQMPVMDGVQATRQIRALPGAVGKTPIVATTANVLAHQIEDYRASGMDGYVAKPVSPAAILSEIARLAG
ncbi:response regulator [Phenylobacterium sp. 20VBR1]|uniref:histidine kinase n=1 Tax=Phenylobacterium glaciei TaxID=2803784 RepID=A0A941HUH0_9CAUL|nr:response regulator [Phenylobacterium glaciei]MBR7618649.1 response regulator [Phenylobacterium glaciei]